MKQQMIWWYLWNHTSLCCSYLWQHIYGLVQDCSYSSASAMELLQSCTKPLISCHQRFHNALTPLRFSCSFNMFWLISTTNDTQHTCSHISIMSYVITKLKTAKVIFLLWRPGTYDGSRLGPELPSTLMRMAITDNEWKRESNVYFFYNFHYSRVLC